MDPLALVAAATIPAAILYSWWRKAPVSLTLAVSMLTVFALEIVAARLDPFTTFATDLAVYKLGSAYSGPLSYVTALFLHADLFHILFNLLFLIALGPLLEGRIGPLRWGVLFFAGGVVSNLVFVMVNYQLPAFALLGASGALSAVFGAFGRLYPRERVSMFIPIPLPPMPVIYWVIGFVVIQLLLSVLAFGPLSSIAWEAHVAGLVFGFAAAPLVMRVPGRRKAEKVRDFSALKPFVRGADLDEILGHLSHETLPEAQEAWLEKFAAKAACPQCGRPLRFSRGALRSDCGWALRL